MTKLTKPTQLKDKKISRRSFLAGALATNSSAFVIVNRDLVSGRGHTTPGEKLNIAAIGAGGMGGYNIYHFAIMPDVNIVALCDVDFESAADSFKRYPRAKKYRDFRKMLEKEKNIDAVVVSTPDHTHALASMMAIKMDKHVYCEKPLSHSVYEARKLAEAIRGDKVATQMGNQGHSSEGARLICEWIWDGALGPVRQVHAWTNRPVWPQGIERPKETPPIPHTLNWDLWLGPAPWRPYHPCYAPFKWRGWWDFGTGAIEMMTHVVDPVFWALKLGSTFSVEASSTKVNSDTFPLASIVCYKFPPRGEMPPVKLTWYDGGMMPARPQELEPKRRMGNKEGGVLFVGDKATLMCGCFAESPRLIPEAKMREYRRPPKTIPRSIGHYKEWIEACKTSKSTGSNFEYAGALTEMLLAGNIAIRTGERLNWDGPNLKFTNSPKANKYIRREYRTGWTL